MAQTAVSWLQECLLNTLTHEQQMQVEGLFQQAKAMEREQIIEAAGTSCQYMCYNDRRSAEQYYNETYNK
jgi:hypothetical protein